MVQLEDLVLNNKKLLLKDKNVIVWNRVWQEGNSRLSHSICLVHYRNSLTDTELQHTNTQRNYLPVCIFVNGSSLMYLESDDKPLEMIYWKTLATTPHFQRMLLQMQRYDLTIKYTPGREILLTDALNSRSSVEIKLDMRVDYIFSKVWIVKLKAAPSKVSQLTQTGCLHQIRYVFGKTGDIGSERMSSEQMIGYPWKEKNCKSCQPLSGVSLETTPWLFVSKESLRRHTATSVSTAKSSTLQKSYWRLFKCQASFGSG